VAVTNASDVGVPTHQSILSLAEMPKRSDRNFVPETILLLHNTIGNTSHHLCLLFRNSLEHQKLYIYVPEILVENQDRIL
jgi:hypothetical protein